MRPVALNATPCRRCANEITALVACDSHVTTRTTARGVDGRLTRSVAVLTILVSIHAGCVHAMPRGRRLAGSKLRKPAAARKMGALRAAALLLLAAHLLPPTVAPDEHGNLQPRLSSPSQRRLPQPGERRLARRSAGHRHPRARRPRVRRTKRMTVPSGR